MATVDTIILDAMNYLQTLNAAVTGVRHAPQAADYPTVLDTANLPFVFTWPGAGEWWFKGGGWAQMRRTYRIICYIQPLAQDDIPSRTVDGATLLQRLINVYVNRANIAQSNPPPHQVSIQSAPDGSHHSDGGLDTKVTFGGHPYAGFELQVVVRSEWLL